jgi:hypothetical protein
MIASLFHHHLAAPLSALEHMLFSHRIKKTIPGD